MHYHYSINTVNSHGPYEMKFGFSRQIPLFRITTAALQLHFCHGTKYPNVFRVT